jgi:hypothetical protein
MGVDVITSLIIMSLAVYNVPVSVCSLIYYVAKYIMFFGHDIPVFYVPCLECPWALTIFVRYVPVSQQPCGHHIPDLFGRLYI